jgi:hypothetical protein
VYEAYNITVMNVQREVVYYSKMLTSVSCFGHKVERLVHCHSEKLKLSQMASVQGFEVLTAVLLKFKSSVITCYVSVEWVSILVQEITDLQEHVPQFGAAVSNKSVFTFLIPAEQ